MRHINDLIDEFLTDLKTKNNPETVKNCKAANSNKKAIAINNNATMLEQNISRLQHVKYSLR